MTAYAQTDAPPAPAPEAAPPPRIPTATYRLQFNRSFTFRDAAALVPYLAALGISDCYASPYFRARAESTHGYDIADHSRLNPAIGDEADYAALVAALREHGMGQVLDIVPNHMGIGESTNTWWMDVLENGPSSVYAVYFDIDWHPVKDALANKVLLPILGQQYGRVLEGGELRLSYEDGAFSLVYYETQLPINPRTYTLVLGASLGWLLETLGADHEHVLEYQSIMTALEHLPPRTETEPARVAERAREKEIIKRRLATLHDAAPEVRGAVERTLELFNGQPGDPRSFDRLDELIDGQAYRLAYWRVAAEEINYRRFFDVNDLAAISMERPEVFEATHRLLMRLLAEGCVTGLRIDHPDGMWDPAGYFRSLQEHYLRAVQEHRAVGDGAPGNGQPPARPAPRPRGRRSPYDLPLYVVVEKILARSEDLPDDWPVHGTTGYDFLNALNSLFVDSSAEKRFNEIYASFIDEKIRFSDLIYDKKKQIMRLSLASEINVLAHRLNRISEHNRYYRDFTLNSLRDALREVIACFPVYRTYIVAETGQVDARDRAVIDDAIRRATRRTPTVDPSVYDFVRDILLLNYPDTQEPSQREEQNTFVMRFQQCTGPVMAKGLEDTAFYIYNRLVSLNEVGGEPQHFGLSPAAFHRQNQERLRSWPASLLASSTHDTKRSEDVRARINVLSELPDQWRKALSRWSRLNRTKKVEVEGRPAPDRNEEYLLYQTLLGFWPTEPAGPAEHAQLVRRAQDYMIKALREAKVNTSWLSPNQAYDQAVCDFVAAILKDAPANRFLADMRALLAVVAHYGEINSLAQTLLKLTSPGVPDIYQGNELWDLSLVDPDNRRPVDYDLRKWLLGELLQEPADRAALARGLVEEHGNGRAKLYLTQRALSFRREHPALFLEGGYTPLEASGAEAEHVVAFARRLDGQEAVVAVPRLLARRSGGTVASPLGAATWGDGLLWLPDPAAGHCYRNILTDELIAPVRHGDRAALPLAELFANFPVALLAKEPEKQATKQPKSKVTEEPLVS